MEQITLKANINECTVEGWQSNTGEVNARVINVEMCEDLCSCARQFVTFELADGTVYESLVVDGKAKIPFIEEPQFIKIGLYAENINGDECEKRYSAHPANVYVNMGAYKNGASETPKPTPGDYAELLEQIAGLKKGTIKEGSESLWELETGVYHIRGGFYYGTPKPPMHLNFMSIIEGYVFITKDSRIQNTTNYYVFADNKIYYGSIMVFENTNAETGEEIIFAEGNVNEMPTSNAVKDYVNEAIKNLGGGSNIDLVTEFEGTDVEYEEKQVYNANAVNIILSALIENFATTEYVNKLIGGIENGSY